MGIHNKAIGMISRYSSVFALFSTVAAFGGGAPNFGQVCNDMKPGHGIPPRSSGFPLTVANGATVGEFCHSTMPVDLQYVNCAAHGRGERSTLTHKVGGVSKTGTTVYWKSNGESFGKVTLFATATHGYSKIWEKVAVISVNE